MNVYAGCGHADTTQQSPHQTASLKQHHSVEQPNMFGDRTLQTCYPMQHRLAATYQHEASNQKQNAKQQIYIIDAGGSAYKRNGSGFVEGSNLCKQMGLDAKRWSL